MTNARECNPHNHPQHIPAEPGPVFWFLMGAIAACSVVLIYLELRF
jgi:hypothetical protein